MTKKTAAAAAASSTTITSTDGVAIDCTSPTTAWVRISSWACEKVANDLGLGGG